MKLHVSVSFILSLALIFLSNSFDYAAIFLISAFIHETGHIVFLKLYKVKKPELYLGLLGAQIRADMAYLSYRREAAVYLGGAFFNLGAALLSLGAMRFFSDVRLIFFFFANLFYALLNLIPIETLDGGRVLESCLLSFTDDPWRAQCICRAVSLAFSSALFFVSVTFLGAQKNNATLVLLLLWVLYQCIFSNSFWRRTS